MFCWYIVQDFSLPVPCRSRHALVRGRSSCSTCCSSSAKVRWVVDDKNGTRNGMPASQIHGHRRIGTWHRLASRTPFLMNASELANNMSLLPRYLMFQTTPLKTQCASDDSLGFLSELQFADAHCPATCSAQASVESQVGPSAQAAASNALCPPPVSRPPTQ